MTTWKNISKNITILKTISLNEIDDSIKTLDEFIESYKQLYNDMTNILIELSKISNNLRILFSFDQCAGKEFMHVDQIKKITGNTFEIISSSIIDFNDLLINNKFIINTYKDNHVQQIIELDIIKLNKNVQLINGIVSSYIHTLQSIKQSIINFEHQIFMNVQCDLYL